MPDKPKTLLDGFGEATEEVVLLRSENQQLLAALERLVQLGVDDGSEPDSAWKDAFEMATRAIAVAYRTRLQRSPD